MMQANIKMKEIRGHLIRQFNRLQKRQRTLVLILAAAILFSLYYNMIYKVQSRALAAATTELTVVNNSLERLKSQVPDTEKEKDRVSIASRSLEALKSRLAATEGKLPNQESIPQLLGDLVRQTSGYSIDFFSIRPKTAKEKKDYPELNIEMKFSASYPDFVNYLNRIEAMSPFMRARDIVVENMKDGFRSDVDATVVLAALLCEIGMGKKEVAPSEAPPVTIDRNPFTSVFRPIREMDKKEEYRLSGIIATGRQPTAIINNEVYRMGDMIGNKTVIKILPSMVVLSEGKETKVLTLEK